jgi:hypothetical protein
VPNSFISQHGDQSWCVKDHARRPLAGSENRGHIDIAVNGFFLSMGVKSSSTSVSLIPKTDHPATKTPEERFSSKVNSWIGRQALSLSGLTGTVKKRYHITCLFSQQHVESRDNEASWEAGVLRFRVQVATRVLRDDCFCLLCKDDTFFCEANLPTPSSKRQQVPEEPLTPDRWGSGDGGMEKACTFVLRLMQVFC